MAEVKRPTIRELNKKLSKAKEALKQQHGLFANIAKAVGELYELDIGDSQEVWPLIKDLLEEISPTDYVGTKPPQKSYEKTIMGDELFAFCWLSNKLKREMYIKFALKGRKYVYVSLHKSQGDHL